MYNKNDNRRAVVMLFIAGIMFFFCAVKLFQLQIVDGKEYREIADSKQNTNVILRAARGEIMDRYGNVLVGNRVGFSVQIKPSELPKEKQGEIIKKLINVLEQHGDTVRDAMPISKQEPLSFVYEDEKELKKITAWKKKFGASVEMNAEETVLYLSDLYHLDSGLSLIEKRKITGVLCELESGEYSDANPYTVATDISMTSVAVLKESSLDFPSVNVVQQQVRYYPNNNLAAHILGTVGIIYREEYEALKGKGYSLDAVIGKQGVEHTFEDYLRGTDGLRSITRDLDGKEHIVEKKQPIPGNQISLTLDLNVQSVMEQKLEETILRIQANEAPDCNAGAAVCLDVNSGEILAIASYPSYNPANFNKSYDTLLKQNGNPLWNRALAGTYEPGSTFKMLTAIAALEEGVITPEDEILDEGVYKYYDDYQPVCLEWRYGKTHGMVNTELALQESCNYYFYEVGRRLGIRSLVQYAEMFGLGSVTGVEIGGEASGTIASPESKKKRNETWYDGDTLQAAIGQSDNLFTPIQLASYTATIANGGTRYRPHLLKTVKNSTDGTIIMHVTPTVEEKISLSGNTISAVKNGMKKVTEEGTAKSAFENFEISVGGKTGTAEVTNGSSNGIFVAFAPFDKPEIAIAIVLEHGGHGASAAPIARAVFEAYFENQKVKDLYQPRILLQ